MEDFIIKKTIKEIIADITENMDVTISMKVEEQTITIKSKLTYFESENEQLKKELFNLKTHLKAKKTR